MEVKSLSEMLKTNSTLTLLNLDSEEMNEEYLCNILNDNDNDNAKIIRQEMKKRK